MASAPEEMLSSTEHTGLGVLLGLVRKGGIGFSGIKRAPHVLKSKSGLCKAPALSECT